MRSKLIRLVLGCGLAVAIAAPALACDFHNTSAKNDQTTTQQTADSQPAATDSQPATAVDSN